MQQPRIQGPQPLASSLIVWQPSKGLAFMRRYWSDKTCLTCWDAVCILQQAYLTLTLSSSKSACGSPIIEWWREVEFKLQAAFLWCCQRPTTITWFARGNIELANFTPKGPLNSTTEPMLLRQYRETDTDIYMHVAGHIFWWAVRFLHLSQKKKKVLHFSSHTGPIQMCEKPSLQELRQVCKLLNWRRSDSVKARAYKGSRLSQYTVFATDTMSQWLVSKSSAPFREVDLQSVDFIQTGSRARSMTIRVILRQLCKRTWSPISRNTGGPCTRTWWNRPTGVAISGEWRPDCHSYSWPIAIDLGLIEAFLLVAVFWDYESR